MEKRDWKNYVFEYNSETKRYYPIIPTGSNTKNITNEEEEKVIVAPEKNIKAYKKYFQK